MKNALHLASMLLLAGIGLALIACTSREQTEDQKISAKFHITEKEVKSIHSKLSVSVKELQEMNASEVQGLIRELHPALPGKRAFYRNLQLGNVGQFTPPERIVASLLSVQKMRLQTRRRGMAGGIRVGLMERLAPIVPFLPNPVPGRK